MARHRVKTFLLASTRGKLLDRLRRAPQTVEELAVALGITDNGVRAHLAVLEQDGLVRRGGLRPTARRPSQTYRLASGAEALFCHGYVPFFGELLNVLAHKMPRPELEATVRSVGERLGRVRRRGRWPLA